MNFVETKNAKIATEVIGQLGPWITFLNGHTRPRKDFRLISQWISELGFRCLLLDHRGSGDTIGEPNFTVADMVDDIDTVQKHYNIDSSIIVGISMGGYLAQEFCARFGEARVGGLILISTTLDLTQLDLSIRPWGTNISLIAERLSSYVSDHFFEKNKLLINAMATQMARQNGNGEFDHRARAQHQALLEHLKTRNPSKSIPLYQNPVLILHGSQDRIIPVEAAQRIHSFYPRSLIQVFENCGHLLLAECSQMLKDEMENFLVKNFSRN